MTRGPDAHPPGERPVFMEGPEFDSREARASLALKIVAAAYVVGILLAQIRASVPESTLLTVAFNAAAAVLVVIYLAVGLGIDRRRPWAWALIRPMLVLLAVTGTYAAVAAFVNGTVRIPYELALAIWAWVGTPDRPAIVGPPGGAGSTPAPGFVSTPTSGPGRRALALLVVAVMMAVNMAFGHVVFGWGGVLDVHPSDLVPRLNVSCGEPGDGLPAAVTLTYAWSWARVAPLPNEVDTVLVGWSGEDAEGRPLYAIDDIPDTAPGIRPGYGELTRPMVDAARATTRSAYRWAVDLGVRRYAPSEVGLGLILTPRETTPTSGTMTVKATYVHLDQWQAESPTVTCTW